MPAADTARLVAELTFRDKFSKGVDRAIKKTATLDKTLSRVGDRAGVGIGKAAQNIERAFVGVGVAGVAGIGLAVKSAADFQEQLQTINTVAGLTQEQLGGVGKNLRGLAKGTGTDLSDLSTAFYDLVSAGIQAGDAMTVLTAANTLAIGGLGTTKETVDLLTTAINAYGLSADQATTVSDQFAEAIAAGKVTASQLAESFATVGPIAAASGIGIDELAAGFARATAQGTDAASAAAGMRSAINALISPNAALNRIQKQTGINFAKLAREKGLVVALQTLRKAADKNKVPLTDLLGRVEALGFAFQVTGAQFDDYQTELGKVQKANGTAAAQMAERQKGLNAQLRILRENARDAAITIGSVLLPKITPLAAKLVGFLQTHQPELQKFADQVGVAFDKALAFAQKIPWDTVGRGIQTAAEWSSKLVDAFLKLPPDFQATIIALAGLNKLSGGAITGIVSELGKGLIKGVLGITAATVNLRAATVIGGGGVGVGGGAAGAAGGAAGAAGETGVGGLIGKGAALLSKALLVGLVAEIASEIHPMPLPSGSDLQWPFGPKNTPTILPEVFGGNGLLGGFAPGTPVPTPGAPGGAAPATGADLDKRLQQLLSKFGDLTVLASHGDTKAQAALAGVNAEIAQVRSEIAKQHADANLKLGDNAKLLNVSNERAEAIRSQVAAAHATATADSGSERSLIASSAATAAAKQQTIAENAAATAQAVREKDLRVDLKNYITTITTVSVRDTILASQKYRQYVRQTGGSGGGPT